MLHLVLKWHLDCYIVAFCSLCFRRNSGIDSETPWDSKHIENQKTSSPSKEYKDRGRNDAASVQHMLSYSTERSSGNKRGRPAARSMQKGKSGVEQVRRARARTAKGPAKISEVESDSSDHTDEKTNAETRNIRTLNSENSEKEFKMLENERPDKKKRGRPTTRNTQKGKAGVEQVRRTRARIAKGSAKIGDVESDSSDSTDEKPKAEETGMEKGNIGTVREENSKTDEFKMLEDRDWKQKGKAIEHIDVAEPKSNVQFGKLPEVNICERYNYQETEKCEKLEVMTDPLQAMLLDMVPSLGMSETKSSSTVLEEKQPVVHNNSEPAKKKVSYKDVASELLKDW